MKKAIRLGSLFFVHVLLVILVDLKKKLYFCSRF